MNVFYIVNIQRTKKRRKIVKLGEKYPTKFDSICAHLSMFFDGVELKTLRTCRCERK